MVVGRRMRIGLGGLGLRLEIPLDPLPFLFEATVPLVQPPLRGRSEPCELCACVWGTGTRVVALGRAVLCGVELE